MRSNAEMIRQLDAAQVFTTGGLGSFCPYYWISADSGVYLADTAKEIIEVVPGDQRFLDPVACLELVDFGYLLGTRTLVRGVGRLPYRATICSDGTITRHAAIPHGTIRADPKQIAEELRGALEEEILTYASNAYRIWILLSGGLDSRVVAGLLKQLQHQGSVAGEVRAVTWGHPLSRDFVYARRIADHLGWPFHSIGYDPNTLWENVQEVSLWGGGEISGLHLHGMQQLAGMLDKQDLVIAASWGNSIGRAMFVGKHLLTWRLQPIINLFSLLSPALVKEWIREAAKDRELAWQKEEDSSSIVKVELDLQENYMRRMIGQAMDYLRQFARLEQAFTSERVVSTMWSYSPNYRVGQVYYSLLEGLDGALYHMPDASTGVSPSGLSEPDPALTKHYLEFGKWCRVDLRDQFWALIHSSELAGSGVFNMSAVREMMRWWQQQEADSWGASGVVTVLAGIALAVRHFSLLPPRKPSPWRDYVAFRSEAARRRFGSVLRRTRRWLP
jgi:hypothetical protein